MIDIKRFILHVSKKDENNKVISQRRIPLKPTDNENEALMKQDIAKRLLKLKASGEWSHWWVVCEIETPEGQRLFRTVIGIHLL